MGWGGEKSSERSTRKERQMRRSVSTKTEATSHVIKVSRERFKGGERMNEARKTVLAEKQIVISDTTL